MIFEARDHGRRWIATALLLSGTAIYIGLAAAQVIASQLGQSERESAVRWSVKLDPSNAEYRDTIARIELLAKQSPTEALSWSRSATALNPHRENYWVDQAVAEQLTGDFAAERISLAHAREANPHSAGLAWQIGNLYLSQGATEAAFGDYRKVLENTPQLAPRAIQICWTLRPDVDFLLQKVIPSASDKAFLTFLISHHESAAATKVWGRIATSRQEIEKAFLFEYLRYLLANHQSLQAVRVWQQAADLSRLAAYQPTDENLLVNGNFSLPILDGGFDWTYQKSSAVMLALDPIETHSGPRSLRIFFEGAGIEDAGIRQIVAVEPNTEYMFSGYYKAEEMDGVGGPRIKIQDLYTQEPLFTSNTLGDSDSWSQITGTLTTGPETNLIVLRVARVPADNPIRGKLWIDDLKLVTASHLASLQKGRQ